MPRPPKKPFMSPAKLRFAWIAFWSGIGFLTLSAAVMYAFVVRHQDTPETIGVSFSQQQANDFGIDIRSAYTAILDDMGAKHLRLAAYWDRIEPAPDRYDFEETDWMLDEAAKRGAKVKLAIGQKLIRVPECYYPKWLDENNSELVEERVNKMLRVVVERYKNHPALESWQLENEYVLRGFGECPDKNFTNEKLATELATVRVIDSTTPIILTQSNQAGFPMLGPITEYYGFSMYRVVWNSLTGYFMYPQRGIYTWWKAAWIETFHPTTVTIHELQAEAWGPVGNQNLSFADTQRSMSINQFKDNLAYARESHIKRFDLWGSEWWYWLKTTQNHPEYWDLARQTVTR